MAIPSLRHLALAASLAALAACGEDPAQDDGLSVGVLTDSPIQGVEYLTTRIDGTTNSAGEFRYKPGDVIAFKLGNLVLGSTVGTGSTMTVTPIQLVDGIFAAESATTRENAVTNLLVLLQSLDEDSNPGNGLKIPAAVVTALQNLTLANAINFKVAPATFAASAELATLIDAVNDAGGNAAAVTPANALAHFQNEFLENLAGSYYGNIGDSAVGIRIRNDGSYLMASFLDDSSGIERGTITWTPANGVMGYTAGALDTNGTLGFSSIGDAPFPYRLSLDGTTFVMRMLNDAGTTLETIRLSRLSNSGSGIGGTWVQGSAFSLGVANYLFLPNGRYILMDPVSSGCGDPGVELGSYQVGSGLLVFSGIEFDTNGCNGAHDEGGTGGYLTPAVSIDAATGSMLWGTGLETFELRRPNNDTSSLP
ncbi:MAG: adhesin [Moraxellaceae bacterium]|jgi:hypothetical protein|nr:adhesin [Moraxellaceae bacterium]